MNNCISLQSEIAQKVENLQRENAELKAKLDNLPVNVNAGKIDKVSSDLTKISNDIDKLKDKSNGSEDRWKQIVNFIVQLAWVILAAYMLTKFGLQAPAVP